MVVPLLWLTSGLSANALSSHYKIPDMIWDQQVNTGSSSFGNNLIETKVYLIVLIMMVLLKICLVIS